MTEDEAKTKWCPFVRITALDGEWETNRGDFPSGALACVASECMAWRVMRLIDTGKRKSPPLDYVVDGYCGLAGNP